MKKMLVVCLISVVMWPGVTFAGQLVCVKQKSMLCDLNECKEIYQDDQQLTVIDLETRSISLCSQKDQKCDPFPLDAIEEVGVFKLYKSMSAVVKVAMVDMESSGFVKDMFFEYRPHLLNVFLAWGMCFEE